jgi:hypothetical protein
MLFINHDKKAIYIHIPKTAGTYIGKMLMKYYGFTSYLKVLLKRRPDHDVVCQSHRFKNVPTKTGKSNNTHYNKLMGLLVYCKTSDYINKICNMDATKWRTYTKFCFIRNPYDRAQSGVKYLTKTLKNELSVDEYLLQNPLDVSDIEFGHVFMTQKMQIQDSDGTCGVDVIGRFENLEEDFRRILNLIGFNKIIHVPQKYNISSEGVTTELKFKESTLKLINQLFADDFNMFHYKVF